MIRKLSLWLLQRHGWTVNITMDEPPESVICFAPHTSNWDFYFGTLAHWAAGRQASFLMKKGWFVFPLNFVFAAIGGIPVDRTKKKLLTSRLAQQFIHHKIKHLAITPEGTRCRTERWRTGFYRIALNAGIPIQLAYIDYAKKETGVLGIFYPSGDEQADIAKIQNRYKTVTAKYPENFYIP